MTHPDKSREVLRQAEADCGCRIPSPFDEVAEHAISLAFASHQDGEIERALDAAQFLSDRLDELELIDGDEQETYRQYMGHADPAHSRLKGALAALSPTSSGREGNHG